MPLYSFGALFKYNPMLIEILVSVIIVTSIWVEPVALFVTPRRTAIPVQLYGSHAVLLRSELTLAHDDVAHIGHVGRQPTLAPVVGYHAVGVVDEQYQIAKTLGEARPSQVVYLWRAPRVTLIQLGDE